MGRISTFNYIFKDKMDFLKRICRELVLAIPLCVIHIREGGTAHTQRVLEEITCYKLSSFLKLEKFRFDLAPVELLIETFLHIMYKQHCSAYINFMLQ